MLLKIYQTLTQVLTPLLKLWLRRRMMQGKELQERLNERYGVASIPRPQGQLIWIHAASVGEALAVLPFIQYILQRHSDIHILVTTGTVTSSQLMAERLPERAFHQFIPLDHPKWVTQFFDHWHPDLILWTESELWPTICETIRRRDIPAALINARISKRSFARWLRFPSFAKDILKAFRLILAQSKLEKRRFQSLSQKPVKCIGNLKYGTDPLPVDDVKYAAMKDMIGDRPVWVVASTHPGEETIVLQIYRNLLRKYPNLLMILVPRHPHRGTEVASLLEKMNLPYQQRSISLNQRLTDETKIYLADTLGELGLFYKLGTVTTIGGSLLVLGHNPIEPAKLDCPITFGPNMHNFLELARDFVTHKAAMQAKNPTDLIKILKQLLEDSTKREDMVTQAKNLTDHYSTVLSETYEQIQTYLK